MNVNLNEVRNNAEKYVIDKLSSFFSERDRVLIIERKKPWIVWKIYLLLGLLYHLYKTKQEGARIFWNNFRDSFVNIQILYEVIFHSRKLLILTLVILLVSSAYYFHIFPNSYLPLSNSIIVSLLTAYFAGVTALLGIIFAFYSVGIQISTSKFSSEVIDYINREKVGQFFFKLLVISGLFSLSVLILQYIVSFPLVIPFVIATFLVVTSLLGILIFKEDYLVKIKPDNLFDQLCDENIRALKLINHYNTPDIKSFSLVSNINISSFKLYLRSWSSWSLVMAQQKKTNQRLRIHEHLFNDLIRASSIDDASHGIKMLGYLMDSYIEIKHFIDTDRCWWFPSYQDFVSAEDMGMFPIKSNYESMGIGKLGVPKSDLDWFEDKIIKQIGKIQNNTEIIKNPQIMSALIYTYETIMAGRFQKTILGLEKKVRGVYESQYFELSERVFGMFIELGEKVTDQNGMSDYINALGNIKTVMMDGFSLRHFPGKVVDWHDEFTRNIVALAGKKKVCDKETIINKKLPKYFFDLFADYRDRLDVELQVEGNLITPISWLEKELVKNVEQEEDLLKEKFLNILLEGTYCLWDKSSEISLKKNINLILFGLLNQLISSGSWTLIEKTIIKYRVEFLKIFLEIKSDDFFELELREPIEFGTFSALVRKDKTVFDFYCGLFFMSQIQLNTTTNPKDLTKMLKLARRPLMLAALAYVVSELEDDPHYVSKVTDMCESLFVNAELSKIFKLTKDAKVGLGISTLFQVINEESNRYRPFYREIINSILELPADWASNGAGIALSQTVIHKSNFIRKLASYRLADMEECFDGYVEWLEKREQMNKLVNIFINMK